jgi:exodeoxyribonuclease VII large subunit
MAALSHGLQSAVRAATVQRHQHLQYLAGRLPQALLRGLQSQRQRLDNAALQLDLLDPHLVLQRGYAWLSTTQGQPISSCQQVQPEQTLRATLSDGTVDLRVLSSNS